MAAQDNHQDNGANGSPPVTTAPTAEETAQSLDGRKAYDFTLPRLVAWPTAAVINTDVGAVAQTALSMPKRLAPVLDELIIAVPNFDFKGHLVLLTTTALSLNFLHAKYRVLRSTTNTVLTDWLTKRRVRFQGFGQILVDHDIVAEADLAALRHTNNHHALGYDVMGLVDMLLTHFDHIDCKLLTREILAEAGAKANELFVELGVRDFGPNAVEEVKLLRRKNFALLGQQFDQLVDAVRYGRSEHGDAAKYIPALYPKRGPRKGEEDTDDNEPSASEVADDAVAAGNSAESSTANAEADSNAADVAAINRNVAKAAENVSGLGVPTSAPFRLTEDK